MAPCIVTRDGKPLLGIGTPGSYGIPQTTLQMLLNALDFGMNVQAAIEAPRARTFEGTLVDAELARLSTVPSASWHRLWRYLAEGGLGNADNFLSYSAALTGAAAEWAEPAPLLRAGLYWPGLALPGIDDIAARWGAEGGVMPVVFYRALVQSGNTAPVDALVQALSERGLRPLPVFVHSLKEPEAIALLAAVFAAHPPAVILNATGFSVAAAGGSDPLQAGCPVLQIVFSGGDEDSWRESARGLAGPRPRDRGRPRRLSAGRRPHRLCRRPRPQLGAAAPEAAG